MEHRLKKMGLTPEQASVLPKQSWVQRPVFQKTLDGSSIRQHDSLAEAAKYAQVQGWTRTPRWPSQQHKTQLPMTVDAYRKLLFNAIKRGTPLWGHYWAYACAEQ
jgi:hypothetical protein